MQQLFAELHRKKKDNKVTKSQVREAFDWLAREQGGSVPPSRGTAPASGYDPIQWVDKKDAARISQMPMGDGRSVAYGRAVNKALLQTRVGEPKFPQLLGDESQRELKAYHDYHDALVMCKHLVRDFEPRQSKYWAHYQWLQERLRSKILTTQGAGSSSGSGGDFIDSLLSSTLVDFMRVEFVAGASVPHISMPSNPFTLPLEGADVKAYLVPEQTSEDPPTAANAIPTRSPATGKVTFTAVDLRMRGNVSDDAEEDAIFGMVDYMRRKFAIGIVASIEDAMFNGDKDSPYLDADSITSTDHRRAWDGLRDLTNAEAKITMGGAALTGLRMLNVLTHFGKFRSRPQETVIALNPLGLMQLVGDPTIRTLENLGNRAPLLSGQVAELLGSPIIQSGEIRADLNASGVYDGSVTNRTIAILYHAPSWAIGDRREVMLESAKEIQTGKFVVVASWRGDFQRVQAESTLNRNVGYVFNILNTATLS